MTNETYNEYKEIKEKFPIFGVILAYYNELNNLLKIADEQGLSIRFTQSNKKLKALNGELVDGPVEPHLYMTTFSWYNKKGDDN